MDSRFDSLLDALVLVCKLYDRPMNRDALTAGLPIKDNQLEVDTFVSAAKRAGLSARLHKRALSSLDNLMLPAVLLLNNRQTAILLEVNDGIAKIMKPEFGESQETISLEALNENYSGYVLLLKQRYQFEGRKGKTLDVKVKHWFWGTLSQSSKIYRDVLIASIFINLVILAMPLFSRNVYDRVIPNDAIGTLWTFAIGITVALTFDFIMRVVRAYFLDVAGKKSDVMLNSLIFEKVQSTEMTHRPKSTGSFAKELQDFDSIRDLITSASMALLIDLPFTIIFLVVIALMGGQLVIVPIVAMIIILSYSFYAHHKIKYAVEQSSRASTEKNGRLIEVLQSPEAVRAYNMQSQNQKMYEDATAEAANWNIKTKLYSTTVGSLSNYIQQMATVATVVLGVYLIQNGDLTMGGLIAVSMLLGRTIAPMSQVAGLITRVNGAKIAFKALDNLMQNPSEVNYDKHYKADTPFKGNVTFKDVSFHYPDAPIQSLHNVSFEIKQGEHIGIIGRIGSGKSTIGKLLMRFYLPTEGNVFVEGVNIEQINPNDMRHHIGYVPQSIQLFHGSVKDNIVLGANHVDDERVEQAVKLSGVNTFTDSHPEGLNLQVGESGRNLSGGQRQLIALARALLLEPSVLILDEPSASMDQSTETLMIERLSTISKHKTLIIATHNPSMLKLVEKLMVVEMGQIAAFDDKATVYERLNSVQGA